jgi:hypothetical protein
MENPHLVTKMKKRYSDQSRTPGKFAGENLDDTYYAQNIFHSAVVSTNQRLCSPNNCAYGVSLYHPKFV